MRTIVLLTWGFGLALSSGCSMCAPGFVDDYATVGGKWQRSDPTQGRVGSIFSDPGSSSAAGSPPMHVVDSHSAGADSAYFGEAYTEGYQGPTEGYSDEYAEGYVEQYGELEDGMGHSEFAPEVYQGGSDAPQFEDQILRLGDEW